MSNNKITMSVVWITGMAGLMLTGAIAWNAANGNPIDVSAGQLASTIFGGFLGYLTRALTDPKPNEKETITTIKETSTEPPKTEPEKPPEDKPPIINQ